MEPMTHHGSMGGSTLLLVLLVILPALLLCLYLMAAVRLRKRSGWSLWRIASYSAGTALIIAAMLPPLAIWAHQDLRGHMVQHLFLGMFGPLGLVFGAPGTLLLRSIPPQAARRVMSFLNVRPVRFLIHPVTAAFLDIGGMYLLYLTPLYLHCMSHPGLFIFLHLHFVLSGYLFTWSIAGPDPAPRRPGWVTRLSVVFVATAAHAVLGKLMFAYGYPQGTPASLTEIQSAAQWMYYGGDLAEFLLIVGFFAMWFRRKSVLPVAFGGESPTSLSVK
ncbi:cytochrome c oxidase assembly protein [Erwinia sp. P6884]|uniref:cytochrome c oxidase assembly protein n=1 Tax=Erwinia sp. P6884 TaxID=3141450 RepID=UPI003195F490